MNIRVYTGKRCKTFGVEHLKYMILASDAPSSKPSPHLYFTLDHLRHRLDAFTPLGCYAGNYMKIFHTIAIDYVLVY